MNDNRLNVFSLFVLFFIVQLTTLQLHAKDARMKVYVSADSALYTQNINDLFDSIQYSNRNYYNSGLSKKYTWILVEISKASNFDYFYFANPTIDEVLFVLYDSLGNINHFISNNLRPFNERVSGNINHTIAVLPNHSKVLIRTYSNKQNNSELVFCTKEEFYKQTNRVDIIVAFYMGFITAMFFYNLFVFLSTRDSSYLWYIVFLISIALTQLTIQGYSYKYFWANTPYLNQFMLQLCGVFSGIATVVFVINFLKPQTYSMFAYRVLVFIIVMDIIALIVLAIDPLLSYKIIDSTAGLGSILVLLVASYLIFKGSRSAIFFMFAWSSFLIAVILYVLRDSGIIEYNNFTQNILLFGSAIEASLLSFALADKINTYRAEKEQAQLQALHTARENERIIKEQNLILEGRVEERTRELQKSNDELEFTLTNLKQTQTQLVEQEKMASLGQLTAGIAHEINNPINFVSSNVKPLKRDMDMMIDLLNRIEQIALSDILQQQKQEQIQKIKNEYDFEYLKEEVGFLLKGIEEGAVRTADIVRGLRIFSRVDEDDLKIADIHEGIDSTLIITTNLMNGKIKLIKNYCDTQKVECYPGKLNQVFLNIISNAVYAIKQKYNDKEGGVLTITTNCDGKYFIIAITDNGCGMPDEVKNKIFEPFFTTKPVGEGTGLGMSIAITTIQRHNGSLDVTSALGEGTTFTIKIPIKQS
jgi:signal transduction histidine kinase